MLEYIRVFILGMYVRMLHTETRTAFSNTSRERMDSSTNASILIMVNLSPPCMFTVSLAITAQSLLQCSTETGMFGKG